MARHTDPRGLTPSNKLYLYRLLADGLGCGKQTFLTRVEEVLEADGLGARDLGFESTRALLEELDGIVRLTVFKGGRLYATVVANPAWDEAIAAAADGGRGGGGAAGGKPWKRKKGARALKPQRPRCVRREAEGDGNGAGKGAPARRPAAGPAASDQEAREPGPADAAGEGSAPAGADRGGRAHEAASPEVPTTSPQGSGNGTASPSDGEGADARADRSGRGVGDACRETAPAPDGSDRRDAALPTAGTAPDGAADAGGGAGTGETDSAAAAPSRLADTPEAGGAEPVRTADAAATTCPAAPREAPRISLTVTFDPDAAHEGPRTIEATGATEPVSGEAPLAGAPASAIPAGAVATREPQGIGIGRGAGAASPAAPAPDDAAPTAASPRDAAPVPTAPSPSHETARTDEPPANPAARAPRPSATALSSYPRDFHREVHCPTPLLRALTGIAPVRADIMAELGEDLAAARGLGLVRGGRARATFPARYLGADGAPVQVSIRRQTGAGAGWAIDAVRGADGAAAGLDGLPRADRGPWDALDGGPVPARRVDPLRELAALVYLGDADALLGELSRRVEPEPWGLVRPLPAAPVAPDLACLLDVLALTAHRILAANDAPTAGADGGTLLDTGLLATGGARLALRLVPTGDDIPWRVAGIEEAGAGTAPAPVRFPAPVPAPSPDETIDPAGLPVDATELDAALARAARSPRVATCLYDPYREAVLAALPLVGAKTGNLAVLALEPEDGAWRARALLSPADAYPLARALSAEQPRWLADAARREVSDAR